MTTIDKAALHAKIAAAGIPIDGVGRNPDKSIRIDFQVTTTDQQKAQAAAIVAAYDQAAEDAAKAAAEAARQADFAELATAKANAALIVIAGDLTEINSDIAGLTAQTAVATLARSLAREKKARQREQVIIKALMRLINA